MKYKELNIEINRGDVGPLYLFSGPEDYLKEEAIRKIKASIINPALNCDILYGQDTDAGTILNRVLTLPFGAPKRLVVVKGADGLSSSRMEELSKYLEDPSPSTCLIFIISKVDKRKKFHTRLEKIGESVVFWPLRDEQIISWISERVKARGKRITHQAAVTLQELLGNNLKDLAGEVDKLLIYIGDREEIWLEDVEDLVPDIKKPHAIFDLISTIGRKKAHPALKILSRLFQEGVEPTKILSMIVKRFREIFQVKSMLAKEVPFSQIAQNLGIREVFLRDIVREAGNFSVEGASRVFEDLLQADLDIKSSINSPQIVLELLILGLCSGIVH
jgi:DNA polymerase-3 subunit delta